MNDSLIPSAVSWAGPGGLTRDQAIRMDSLRLALVVVLEQGLNVDQALPIADKFYGWITQ